MPGTVASSLHTETTVTGTTVTGRVYTDFQRAAESEAAPDDGGWMIGGARDAVAQRAT